MKLKIGDIVRLKSGGPDMTISYESSLRSGEFTCIWFVNGEERGFVFREETLIAVTAKIEPETTPK